MGIIDSVKSMLKKSTRDGAPEGVDEFKISKITKALEAKDTLAEDFFGGWEAVDVQQFARFAAPNIEPHDGIITDFLGIRTTPDLHPWASHLIGTVSTDLPIPDDGLKAEAIEYHALFTALENAKADIFTICELGASYAPWACTASALALRMGMRPRVVAVEASSYMCALIEPHFTNNGVTNENADLTFIQGAVSTERGKMYFPVVANAGENGGQATQTEHTVDYVGRTASYEEVEAYPLQDILPDDIDFLHVDIQGAELGVLTANAKILNSRVRSIFIGTHSRRIEGELIEFFHQQGWTLHRERPCRIKYHADRPNVIGWTTRDGGQFWVNNMI